MSKKVIVNGAFGQMGQLVSNTIEQSPDFELVAKLGKKDNLSTAIQSNSAEIVIDFTVASAAFNNAHIIIDAGAHPVVGTSGFLPEQINTLKTLCQEKQLGAIIGPNFSIGAVLMMKYAQDAANYLGNVEIIEMHHDGKQDAPSGTAIKTASMLTANNKINTPNPSKEIIANARGASQNDVHIHSIRLPGLVAHQQVIFGGVGETLTIKHDSINRECFMPGVLLACKKVSSLKELVYGLEHLI